MPFLTDKNELKLTEQEIQYAIFEWIRALTSLRPVLSLVVAYPSQGGAGEDNIRRGKVRKKEGQAKGFPDIMILVPKGKYHGAFLEVKREGEKPRKEQTEWLEELKLQGYKAEWRAGYDECIKFICEYLEIKE